MPGNAPKTSRHLEVERKFDVGESTVSPSFEGIAAVARVEKRRSSRWTRCTSTRRPTTWHVTRSPCDAAPVAPTPVGT